MKISSCQYSPYRKDQNKYGRGKVVFLREALIARLLRDFEEDTTETICLELTIYKKIGLIILADRPPINNNKDIFFSELSYSLNHASMKYDNLLIIKDLNTNTLNKKKIMETIFLIYVIPSL